ncbi:hypothetical protein Tsubulata_013438 [Turnera subulata]|uniref:Legume lectin domain-containing protein n=1 Tax=Turnera subulata TaxID=218843 RepID=A0A9Q0FTM2_9ROSI|nr:hypothetical protein Tsubulata_013438 [Turnera subulata]
MSAFRISTSTSLTPLLLMLHLLTLTPISTLSLQTLTTTTGHPNLDPEIILLGNAKFDGNGSLVLLTTPSSSDSGLLFYKRPFKFPGFASLKTRSFSTEFAFSLTGKENSLFLFMGPRNFAAKFLGQGPFAVLSEKGHVGVEFFTSKRGNVGVLSGNVVAVNVGNVSTSNGGEKLKSWVDFDAGSKRLEARLSVLGEKRPLNPIVVYPVDVSEMWHGNEVYVGLGSFIGNLSETCSVYSWRFRLGNVGSWMHSLPADPHAYKGKGNGYFEGHDRFCRVIVFAGLILAYVCGALLVLLLLNALTTFIIRKVLFFGIDNTAQPANFRFAVTEVHVGNVVVHEIALVPPSAGHVVKLNSFAACTPDVEGLQFCPNVSGTEALTAKLRLQFSSLKNSVSKR